MTCKVVMLCGVWAMVAWAQLPDARIPDPISGMSLIPMMKLRLAGHTGDVQVRNMGTIGGSAAHADPSADYPAALQALEAQIVLKSASVVHANSDLHASADYRKHLASVYAARALTSAISRA